MVEYRIKPSNQITNNNQKRDEYQKGDKTSYDTYTQTFAYIDIHTTHSKNMFCRFKFWFKKKEEENKNIETALSNFDQLFEILLYDNSIFYPLDTIFYDDWNVFFVSNHKSPLNPIVDSWINNNKREYFRFFVIFLSFKKWKERNKQ